MKRHVFSKYENELLMQLISEKKDIIDCKEITKFNSLKKTEAFNEIAKRFNSDPNVIYRSAQQLRQRYLNCKKQAAKQSAENRREIRKSGGEVVIVNISSLSEKKPFQNSYEKGCHLDIISSHNRQSLATESSDRIHSPPHSPSIQKLKSETMLIEAEASSKEMVEETSDSDSDPASIPNSLKSKSKQKLKRTEFLKEKKCRTPVSASEMMKSKKQMEYETKRSEREEEEHSFKIALLQKDLELKEKQILLLSKDIELREKQIKTHQKILDLMSANPKLSVNFK